VVGFGRHLELGLAKNFAAFLSHCAPHEPAALPAFRVLQRKTVRIERFVSTCRVIGIGARQRFARSNA
jgi:hypothetical protein